MPGKAATVEKIFDGQLLTGHVAEWGELLGSLQEQVGLTVLVADPLSGASLLLQAALKENVERYVAVDARVCGDARDLAMAIADAAVAAIVRTGSGGGKDQPRRRAQADYDCDVGFTKLGSTRSRCNRGKVKEESCCGGRLS